MSRKPSSILLLLLGWPALATAQSNGDLAPYTDTRIGGPNTLQQGRASDDNDSDLLVARELFNDGLGLQAIYFRIFDGSADLDRLLVQVDFVGAEIEQVGQDAFSLIASDFFAAVGAASDYGGFDFSRGIELAGGDALIRVGESALLSLVTTNGIDDVRFGVSFPDLDPGGRVNRGNAAVVLTMLAGGPVSAIDLNRQTGSFVGVQVGDDGVLDAGDYTIPGIEPEGAGVAPPSTTQIVVLRLLFEDLDIAEEVVSIPSIEVGQSAPVSVLLDNFGQGDDLDNDNAADLAGLDVPNLPLVNLKLAISDFDRTGGGSLPAAVLVPAAVPSELPLFTSTSLLSSLNIPGNAAPGAYTGLLTVWEDNDDDGILDAGETSDEVLLSFTVALPPEEDTDQDGLSDDDEDANQNGLVDANETDPNNPDTDGDGLLDGTEVNGLNPTNPLDEDSDNDGLEDGEEDANQNGTLDAGEPDPNDADTDDGGEPDGSEVAGGRDPLDPSDDLLFDPNADPDNDGLSNGIEALLGTNRLDPDTDNDGLLDGEEDADRNGVRGLTETDALDNDSDDDGLLDGTEVLGDNPTEPLLEDSDSDGLPDGCEDHNQNGAFNNGETNPNALDTDDDGLPDGNEDANANCAAEPDEGETDPTDADTDDGGEPDGSEVEGGRDPLDPADDLLPGTGLFTVGGGACTTAPGAAGQPLWLLLGLGLLLGMRRRR